jgi:hypothetical protein
MNAKTERTATQVAGKAPAHTTAASLGRFTRDVGTAKVSTVSPDKSATVTPSVVATEGGLVTLQALVDLRARLSALQQQAADKSNQAASLRSLADDRWRQLGAVLLASVGRWSPDPQLTDLVHQAEALKQKLDADDSELNEIHGQERKGVSGVFGRIGDWNKGRGIGAERISLEAQLNPALVQIGRQAVGAMLPEADTIRAQAVAAEKETADLSSEAADAETTASAVNEEIQRRSDSEREQGFDAPYLAANLKAHGPTPIESPLIMKKGEQACLAVPATLARQQTRRQWVGGSQGFSFPIGHTGIRYRVGSFHGHPIEQQSLGKLDAGTLVVTNQRIAFIGKVKSTSTPFAKLLHVECYSDAVAVFQEGRENPDFYLTAQPKYALFMINWYLNQAA